MVATYVKYFCYFYYFELIAQTTLYSDQGGYLSPLSLHSSSTNLTSQTFNDSAVVLAVSVSKR